MKGKYYIGQRGGQMKGNTRDSEMDTSREKTRIQRWTNERKRLPKTAWWTGEGKRLEQPGGHTKRKD